MHVFAIRSCSGQPLPPEEPRGPEQQRDAALQERGHGVPGLRRQRHGRNLLKAGEHVSQTVPGIVVTPECV